MTSPADPARALLQRLRDEMRGAIDLAKDETPPCVRFVPTYGDADRPHDRCCI